MKIYFLKKYHQIVSFENDLLISSRKKELKIENNEYHNNLLKRLAGDGIAESELVQIPVFQKLQSIKALELRNNLSLKRNELFFQSLGYKNLPVKAKSEKILVLGAGGGGSTLVYLLAQFGFKNIIVLDYDIVEQCDIEKTMIYNAEDIGNKKIDALKRKILRNFDLEIITFDSRIEGETDLANKIAQISPALIVNAIDPGPSHKLNLNRICFEKKVPFVYMAYSFDQLLIGPFLIPGLTDCYNSYNNEIKISKNNESGLSAFKKVDIVGLFHPSISFNINTLASIILKDIIFFFYNKPDNISSLNKLVTMSLITMKGVAVEMQCDKGCACKNLHI